MNYFKHFLAVPLMMLLVSGCGKKQQPISVLNGKIKKEVISFSPKISGRIAEIYVQEGQTVKVGDTLAKLDLPEVAAKIKQTEGLTIAANAQEQMARNGATKNQLNQLKAKQRGIQEQFQFAQSSFARAKNMFNDSLMSPQNFEEVQAKYLGAKAQLDAVNAEYNDIVNGTRLEKLEMAAGQTVQANGAMQEVQTAYRERYIIATNDMEIETITLNKGELATAGYALFTGYIPQSTYFRFTVPESKIEKFKKSSALNMQVPYNKMEITGKIVSIKQMAKYADITTAFPDYDPGDAVYEIKVMPVNLSAANDLLVNANILLN
ncbi:MAG TPA: biotin/lipoyl-binding protein [Niabella sp.]|nr:biotin/lipoyl-binding protein [Niabella sp.]HOZ96740.1 biotin/lipoyl-binding protein [Niabella sp.]HQW14783.1 biotin/lipoyl-binding protein [Niabella sp.]HQX19965.1 biotin/lipoyl-binding protein [Niabella sp.]HQX42203.1 biotin/lipoyl-binding protein [Niabella sp.]